MTIAKGTTRSTSTAALEALLGLGPLHNCISSPAKKTGEPTKSKGLVMKRSGTQIDSRQATLRDRECISGEVRK